MKKICIAFLLAFSFAGCSSLQQLKEYVEAKRDAATAENDATPDSDSLEATAETMPATDSLEHTAALITGPTNTMVPDSDSLEATAEITPATIPVENENFNLIVTYIEKAGYGGMITTGAVTSWDYAIPVTDTNGNHHTFTALRRDAAGNPSINGTVDQLTVVCFKKDDINREHPLTYTVSRDKVTYNGNDPDGAALASGGYAKLLQEAKAYRPPQPPADDAAPAPVYVFKGHARG